MRFLLAASGSRGDVQPMLALAVGLRAAGHDAILAARPAYGPEAAASGVVFHPVGMDPPEPLGQAQGPASAPTPTPVVTYLQDELGAQLAHLPALAAQVDRVVGAGMTFAARSAAEAAGVPYLAAAYSPGVIAPRGAPPIALPAALLHPLRQWRAERGLPAIEHLVQHTFPEDRTLLVADPEIVGPLDRLPFWFPPTGALLLQDPRPLSAGLEAFLQAGEPPVYFGFGSMSGAEPALTAGLVRKVVETLGCRALLFTGDRGEHDAEPRGRVLCIGATAHDRLFPRLAAVVHHGGAGTTAAAARAGIPQLAIPHAFDQFYWAARLHALGIAPAPIPARGIDAAQLTTAVSQALGLGDTRLRERARDLQTALAARNGVATVVHRVTGPLP